jgi:hypothetical protein
VTDAFLARLLQPAPAVATASPKKLQISKPEMFDGERDTKFRPWWRSVKDYLAFHRSSLTEEADKIRWIGFQMKGKARTWHQARAKQLDALHAEDTWTAYSSALEARFQDEREQENEERKMRELKYEGDIDHYVTQLREYNDIVCSHGPAFRYIIRQALPRNILQMVYNHTGGMPQEDEEFLAAVQSAGRVVEMMKRDEVMNRPKEEKGKSAGAPRESTQKGPTTQGKAAGAPRESTRKGSETQGKKGSQQKDAGEKKGDKAPKKDKIWPGVKEALAGVPQEDIDAHKKSAADCWRCGSDTHRTLSCYAKKTKKGTVLPAAPGKDGKAPVVAATKRKRDSEDEEDRAVDKKAKVAAVMDRDGDSVMGEAPRIWEIESSDEMSDF